jgi:predicted nucleic acid-binding protein
VVILVDSSAWVEYLRATGSEIHIRLRAYHDNTSQLAITEVVAMELLAGVRTPAEEDQVDRIVAGLPLLGTAGLEDFVTAADLYRLCRRAGETVRRMTDCIIAAVAIRNRVPVLHRDADFDVLARHTDLEVA